MQVSEKGLAFVAAREACVLTAYRDTTLLAIGFGRNDPSLSEGDTITLDEAVTRFVDHAVEYETDVDKVFDSVPLQQQHYDALFSLTYNIGGTQLRKELVLISAVKTFFTPPMSNRSRDLAGMALLHARFTEESGPFNLSRRCREALLFMTGEYGDISTLKLWPVGTSPRAVPSDPPVLVPMPTFRRGVT